MIPAQALQRLIEQGDISIKHVWHEKNCPDNNAGDCTCGYRETLSGWEKAKKELLEVFENTDMDSLRVLLGNVLLAKINTSGSKGTYVINNGDLERAVTRVRQRYTLPIVMDQVDLDQALSFIFQWKLKSAYEKADATIGFPPAALGALHNMAERFGNCGYQEGKIFDELKENIKMITAMLGYEFDDSRSNTEFVRRQTTVPA
jgi:hypothetical protein